MKFNLYFVLFVIYPCILCSEVLSSFNIEIANKQSVEVHSLFNGFQIETALNISKCVRHFRYIMERTLHGEIWAIKFVDSWGSIPSGMLSNNVISFGDFDQCLSIHEKFKDEVIQGQYCLARISVRNIVKIFDADYISIGICMPASCNVVDVQAQLVEAMELIIGSHVEAVGIFSPDLCTSKANQSLQTEDIFVLTIFSLIGLLTILSTGYHYFSSRNKFSDNPKKLFVCFSLLENGTKLFTLQDASLPTGMKCLHGIWCISTIFIVWNSSFDGFYKWELNLQSPLPPPPMLILFLIDTIFLIEGFFVAKLVFEKCESKSYLTIPRLCFHKYLRLTIVFAITILFCSTLFKYNGSGPVWNAEVATFEPCRRYWWSALTHIQGYTNPDEMCITESWYLSTSMQLYTISLALLLPFRRWRLKCVCGVSILIVVCMTSSYFTLDEQYEEHTRETSKGYSPKSGYLMYRTIHGAVAWLIGILLGYIILWNKERNSNMISTCQIRIGWALSFLLVTSIVVFTIDHQPINDRVASIENIVIKLFSRFAWSLNISWVIFVCSQGNGGLLNSLLSLRIWYSLSRYSYGVYIIHFVINVYMRSSTKSTIHPSYLEKMQYLLGNLIVTTAISISVALAIELRALNLEEVLWKQLNWYLNRHKYNVERQSISVLGNGRTPNVRVQL